MTEYIHIMRQDNNRHLQLLEVKRRQYENKLRQTIVFEKLEGLSDTERIQQSDAYAHFFYAKMLLSLLMYWGKVESENVLEDEVFCAAQDAKGQMIQFEEFTKAVVNLQRYAAPIFGVSYILETLSAG